MAKATKKPTQKPAKAPKPKPKKVPAPKPKKKDVAFGGTKMPNKKKKIGRA